MLKRERKRDDHNSKRVARCGWRWMKKNDLLFYLYYIFHFYVSNHPRGESKIMGKTKSKIKKKKRRLEQKAIQNGTANAKLLKKGESMDGKNRKNDQQ